MNITDDAACADRSPCGFCGTEVGKACDAFCSIGRAEHVDFEDLIMAASGVFAAIDCPDCEGSGREGSGREGSGEITSSERRACRCLVASLEALSLRAAEFYERARAMADEWDGKSARRFRTLAHGCDTTALAAALRELDVPATVHHFGYVTITTPFGDVLVGGDDELQHLWVIRSDGTAWQLDTVGDVRTIATTLRRCLPELSATEGDRLVWLIAMMSKAPDRTVVWLIGRDARAYLQCGFCEPELSENCGNPKLHAAQARAQYGAESATVVFGAFPMADAPDEMHALMQAEASVANACAELVGKHALVIT